MPSPKEPVPVAKSCIFTVKVQFSDQSAAPCAKVRVYILYSQHHGPVRFQAGGGPVTGEPNTAPPPSLVNPSLPGFVLPECWAMIAASAPWANARSSAPKRTAILFILTAPRSSVTPHETAQ